MIMLPKSGRFTGVGGGTEVLQEVWMPVGIAGTCGMISSIEVEADIPLLLSRTYQTELGIHIHTQANT